MILRSKVGAFSSTEVGFRVGPSLVEGPAELGGPMRGRSVEPFKPAIESGLALVADQVIALAPVISRRFNWSSDRSSRQ